MTIYQNVPTDGSDVFLAPLQGRLVECISIEDAVAIKTANGIIGNSESRRFSPFALDRLVVVLRRYGCDTAADAIAKRSKGGA